MKQPAIAIAITTVMVAAGLSLSVAPAVLASDTDCHENYQITATEQTRFLNVSESEVGLSEVSAPDDEVLNVTLETNDAVMEFSIKESDISGCENSDNVNSDCQGTVELNTTGALSTDSIECTLFAPNIGDRDFYVPTENVGVKDLQHTIRSD